MSLRTFDLILSYLHNITSMRTTLDIDGAILREIKAIQESDGRPMRVVISELLGEALAGRRLSLARPPFRWISRAMKCRVDLAAKEKVYAALDASGRRAARRRGKA